MLRRVLYIKPKDECRKARKPKIIQICFGFVQQIKSFAPSVLCRWSFDFKKHEQGKLESMKQVKTSSGLVENFALRGGFSSDCMRF